MNLKVDPKKIKVGDMVRTGGVMLYEVTDIIQIPYHSTEKGAATLMAVTLECREKNEKGEFLSKTIRESPWILNYATYDPDWYIEKLWKEEADENL